MAIRTVEIINYLEQHGPTPCEQLATSFGVSQRSIRSYVIKANDLLGKSAHIECKRGKGYILTVLDDAQYQSALTKIHEGGGCEERIRYLIDRLINTDAWVTLDELARELYVSRRSITSDLRRVKAILDLYDLRIDEKPRHGIKIVGPEFRKRLCLAASVVTSENDIADDWPLLSDNLAIISNSVHESIGTSLSLNPAVEHNLIVHLAIAVKRIKSGCYIPMNASQVAAIRNAANYEIAQRIARSIEESFDIELPETEVSYIAIHLAGKQFIEDVSEEGKGLIISDEIWSLVQDMIEIVQRAFGQDFHDDLELRMNLARHLVPLSVRLQYNLKYPNPLLDDIKRRFPLAYAMAQECTTVLANRYERPLDESEIGYIALSFALAVERQKGNAPRKNILIVCASGAGTAKLLEHIYRDEFGRLLGEIRTCDVTKFPTLDLSGIDYIFTTVPLPIPTSIPVREVQFFLDESDIHQIRSELSTPPSEHESNVSPFSKDLFFCHQSFRNKEQALDFMCEKIGKVRCVPDNFRDLVHRREELAPTCFSEGIALPHPIRPVSNETFVCVCALDEPLLWNGHSVSIIMLLSVAAGQPELLGEFYKTMVGLVTDQAFIQQLVADQRLEVVQHAIQEGKVCV